MILACTQSANHTNGNNTATHDRISRTSSSRSVGLGMLSSVKWCSISSHASTSGMCPFAGFGSHPKRSSEASESMVSTDEGSDDELLRSESLEDAELPEEQAFTERADDAASLCGGLDVVTPLSSAMRRYVASSSSRRRESKPDPDASAFTSREAMRADESADGG